jgi:hypothetical protein
MVQALGITLTRGKDAKDVLAITRADGSRTWSRESQPFLSFHDLAHYVVESTLGMQNGFYGLVAQGWDITTFADKTKAKDIPPEAIWVEHAVNLLMLHNSQGPLSAGEFNDAIGQEAATRGEAFLRPITDAELTAMTSLLNELHYRWRKLQPGESIELAFAQPVARAPSPVLGRS